MTATILTSYLGNPVLRYGNLQSIPYGSTADDCTCCCVENCCDGSRWKCGTGAPYAFAQIISNVTGSISGAPVNFRDYQRDTSTAPLNPNPPFPDCTTVNVENFTDINISGLDALNGTYGGALVPQTVDADCETVYATECELWMHREDCRWYVVMPAVPISGTKRSYSWDSQHGLWFDTTTAFSGYAYIDTEFTNGSGTLFIVTNLAQGGGGCRRYILSTLFTTDTVTCPTATPSVPRYNGPGDFRMFCEPPATVTDGPIISYPGVNTDVTTDNGYNANCPTVHQTSRQERIISAVSITGSYSVVV